MSPQLLARCTASSAQVLISQIVGKGSDQDLNKTVGTIFSTFMIVGVVTTVLGLAASMGAVIASSGEKGHRKALPYSRFMIHQPSSGVGYSTFRDQQIHLQEMESLKHDLYDVLAQNSGRSIEEIESLCDRDKWMKAEEAIQLGFLDEIVVRKSDA